MVAAINVSDGPLETSTVTLVVGDPEFEPTAWVASGTQPAIRLPALDGTTRASWAIVSASGAHAVGTIASVSNPHYAQAVRWTRSGDSWSLTEDLGPGLAVAITADGRAVLGQSIQGAPWVWTETAEGGEPIPLGLGASGRAASANNISENGSIIVGSQERPSEGRDGGNLAGPVYWVMEEGQWRLNELQTPDWLTFAADRPAWAVAVAEVDGQAIIVGNVATPMFEIHDAVAWIPGPDGEYGAPIALAAEGGGPTSAAAVMDINSSGAAVGRSWDGSADPGGVAVVWQVVDRPQLAVNAGHAGAWYNPETPGQGILIDVDPSEQGIFLAWFTFTDSGSDDPDQQHWYTAQGQYSGGAADLDLNETLGGRFDDPTETSTGSVGRIGLTFSSCDQVQFDYSMDADGRDGAMYLQRLIPGSGDLCEQMSAEAPGTQSVDINSGMSGAWVNQNTPGQGFLIDAHPNPSGNNFIFVAWFTYGEETMSGQRWMTAQGSFAGATAEIPVSETTGGRFDSPQSPETRQIGVMAVDFGDCSNAWLSYSLDDYTLEGAEAITRLAPGGQALCEELAGSE